MIEARDIRDGLVLHLDSDELEASGGRCSENGSYRVQGSHFFVCIAADERSGNWVPLFSTAGPYRDLVPNEEKSGHPKWCESTTYFHCRQVWQAPHAAVIDAAVAGGDRSPADLPNTLTDRGVDLVYRTIFRDPAR